MKRHRLVIPSAALSLALAACGGGAATQAPAGATTNPGGGGGTATDVPQATDAPVATQSGGGGGGTKPAGWDQYGKVHIELTGPTEKSGDYGFIPAGSFFGGAQGSSLNFTNEGSNEIVSILISTEGKVSQGRRTGRNAFRSSPRIRSAPARRVWMNDWPTNHRGQPT